MGLFIKICFLSEATRHMLQIVVFQRWQQWSFPSYVSSQCDCDIPLIKWWNLCLLFLHLSGPKWLPWPVEYGASDTMWLLKLSHKNAIHFCFTLLEHLLLTPSHHQRANTSPILFKFLTHRICEHKKVALLCHSVLGCLLCNNIWNSMHIVIWFVDNSVSFDQLKMFYKWISLKTFSLSHIVQVLIWELSL